jgi:gamma-glutamylcyclotransferase (GGCT)/AIG2-like uncharacterized protein YtfP
MDTVTPNVPSPEFLSQPSPKGIRIICYGSLKQGGKLHHNMREARFLGTVAFPGQLYSLGAYPAARPPEGPEDVVHGEVYECSDELVRRLDSIEGHPWMYKRTPIETAQFGSAQVYIYQHRPRGHRRIESGIYDVKDWK